MRMAACKLQDAWRPAGRRAGRGGPPVHGGLARGPRNRGDDYRTSFSFGSRKGAARRRRSSNSVCVRELGPCSKALSSAHCHSSAAAKTTMSLFCGTDASDQVSPSSLINKDGDNLLVDIRCTRASDGQKSSGELIRERLSEAASISAGSSRASLSRYSAGACSQARDTTTATDTADSNGNSISSGSFNFENVFAERSIAPFGPQPNPLYVHFEKAPVLGNLILELVQNVEVSAQH